MLPPATPPRLAARLRRKRTARLVHRTAYQMAVTYSLINAYTELYPENSIIVEGIPTYNEIIEMGLENLFKPLP